MSISTIEWGNPFKVRPLVEISKVTPSVRSEDKRKLKIPEWAHPVVEQIKRINAWAREHITGFFEKKEKDILKKQYTFCVNIFLRHIDVLDRKALVENLVRMTKRPLKGEVLSGAAVYIRHAIKSLSLVKLGDVRKTREITHEAIHVLQDLELMPVNYALTYAMTHLLDLVHGRETFIKDASGLGYVEGRYETRDTWFRLVREGKTNDAMPSGLRLDENEHLRHYVENEVFFNRQFRIYGEVVEDLGGLKNPYDIMLNVGKNRAIRAYAIGYFSGNVDHSFTLLWLHSLGYPFDECERYMISLIESRDIHKLYDYQELI
jgi:hypothetical protein